ncbi:MAG: hypothetical protein HUJ25_01545 [Crocinitomicaceae bacterium]|nr:hypothetical protein [Crocinitomicaceae bacterium]
MKINFLFITVLTLLTLSSCRKDKINLETHLVLMKVDYMTYNLEGGVIFDLGNNPNSNTVQIGIEYEEPNDLGYIKLFHIPDSILLFDGSILWSGTGQQYFPDSLNSSVNFPISSNIISAIDSSRVNEIFIMPTNQDSLYYQHIWDEINEIQLVQEAYNQNFDFSIFCYTPSIGIGNPLEWDYFVYFYVQQ